MNLFGNSEENPKTPSPSPEQLEKRMPKRYFACASPQCSLYSMCSTRPFTARNTGEDLKRYRGNEDAENWGESNASPQKKAMNCIKKRNTVGEEDAMFVSFMIIAEE